jgi:hypothetical protein
MKLNAITIVACLLLAPIGRTWAQDDQSRQHFLHELGGPFFVSRDKVQEELKLSDGQKQKLRETMTCYVQETINVQKLKSGEREQAIKSLRQKSYPELEVFLNENLTPEQLKRFRQLKFQYDVPSILVQLKTVNKLEITEEQRQQFIAVIEEMQSKIEPLMKAAKSGGNPEEILPKVIKLRRDCEAKIIGLMTAVQKQQWQEMTGELFNIW